MPPMEDNIFEINILVPDLDNCTVSLNSKRSDLLSSPLIDWVLEQNKTTPFHGSVGCTQRSILTASFVKNGAPFRALYTAHPASEISNIQTSKIEKNFSDAVQIPSLGISMVDDVAFGKFGSTYHIISQYEQSGASYSWRSVVTSLLTTLKSIHSKNIQLLQIAQFLAEKFPDKPITMTYVDDKKRLCDKAITAPDHPDWPSRVKLNIALHRADETDRATVQPIYQQGQQNPTNNAPSNASLCRRFGLFAISLAAIGVAAVSHHTANTTFSLKS